MNIILKQDLPNLGHKDDIVAVKDGYARNYLIPKGFAVLATPSAKKMLAETLKQRSFKEEKVINDAGKVAWKFTPDENFNGDVTLDVTVVDDDVATPDLLGPSSVVNSLSGTTSFSGGSASPRNLPSGNSVGFGATLSYSADSSNRSQGLNESDDMVGIILGLGTYSDYGHVLEGVALEDIRFGLRVSGINDKTGADANDSFVSTVVPVPAAFWLLLSGVGVLAGIKRRKF